MKIIKSITKNNKSVKLVDVNGMFLLLVNDNPVSNSMEYNYINEIYEKWSTEIS